MLLEPTPIRRPSRRSRAGLLVGLTIPPVILASVVGLAIAGGRDGTDRTGATTASPSTATGPPTTSRTSIEVAFPDVVAGLPVRSVGAALEDDLHGRIDGLVAIRGYLSVVGLRGDCAWIPIMADDLFCQRELRLADTPSSDRAVPALSPTAMPGVIVPEGSTGASSGPAQIPAVVVGVFGEARAGGCFVEGKVCGPSLVVEFVAWADGVVRRPRQQLGPGVTPDDVTLEARTRREIRTRNLPGSGAPLLDIAVRPTTLRAMDPAAAAAIGPTPPDVVWYVRASSSSTSAEGRDVAWLVIDDASGRILAGWDPASRLALPAAA